MKQIQLTQGKFAIVDDEDFDFLNRFSWYPAIGGVITRLPKQNGKTVYIEMWRFLLTTKNEKGEHFKKEVLYIDKNNLNLQKSNLKIINIPTTLHTNRKRSVGNGGLTPTSLYKGVSCQRRMSRKKNGNGFYQPIKPWRAEIQYEGNVHTKTFATEKEAALWYNEKSKEFYGEHAYQNEII